MDITIVGGGYIGTVSAVCLCEFGFTVGIVEINAKRLEQLKNAQAPIYEPNLNAALKKHLENGKLKLSKNLLDFCEASDVIIICVSTLGSNGEDSDLSSLHEVIRNISLKLNRNNYKAVFIKTTVPVGTCSILLKNIQFMRPDLIPGEHYDLVSNPSFLREGAAIHDFMHPDRILIGTCNNSQKAEAAVQKVYKSLKNLDIPFVVSNFETIELARYATTSFVVAKMAFFNELANLCSRIGGNINTFSLAIGLDSRIGKKLVTPTPGYGGTSYPRNVRGLLETADTLGVDLSILKQVVESNKKRIESISKYIKDLLSWENGGISNKKVAIWGIPFKQQTSDFKEAPSLFVIKELLAAGIQVSAYDPVFKNAPQAAKKFIQEFQGNELISLCDSVYNSANQSDMLVIFTDWTEFFTCDLNKIYELMNKPKNNKPFILDCINILDKKKTDNFTYISHKG